MKPKIGSWITLNDPSIAEVMADAGFDWLCIDIEHTAIDYYEVKLMVISIQSKGIEAYVRVGENNRRIIKRVLDLGVDGIIIPNIKTKKDALYAIDSSYYQPIGNRGVGLARAQSYGFDFENYRKNKSNSIKLILQIENISAINNLESILSLDHIYGTFIGPFDLSSSLGKIGKLEHPIVLSAIKKYEEISNKYDKIKGFHVVPIDYKLVKNKIDEGYKFIGFGFDAYFMGNSIRDQLNSLKFKL